MNLLQKAGYGTGGVNIAHRQLGCEEPIGASVEKWLINLNQIDISFVIEQLKEDNEDDVDDNRYRRN